MRSSEEEDARLLAPLREAAPSEETTVSVERAIAAGRRKQRARRLGGAGAVAVVVALAAVVLPGIVRSWNDPGELAVSSAPAEFDVLRQQFTAGSAGGFAPYAYETGRYRQRMDLKRAGTADPGAPVAEIALYVRGQVPYAGDRQWDPGAGTPAPAVGGHRAVYLDAPVLGVDRTELAWEWTDGAWAFASVPSADPDAKAKAHHVAESVAVGANTPVRVPFTIDTAGKNRLLGVVTPASAAVDQTAARLVLGTVDAPQPGAMAEVGLRAPVEIPANTVIDGRPAVVVGTSATILDVGGAHAAEASTDDSREYPVDRLRELVASLRLTGSIADSRTWAENPLR
ncbi:hypothetical protein [Amycolatopsis sp. CA-230715]|uniref:hypothetical protein n=1 Tax=Amycolatopsis sp. CA-230715 TaxID=2745196 RepID=UPI001C01BFE0|nr:hypothetical protein [Amycolatopsis sp. CA-230715]QWF84629.1 hypothetical protein HUW46_08080 [Amycolatopsis sp. CA-230715]